MPQYNYTPLAGQLGSRATTDAVCSVSRVYAGQPQISTLTVAGTATDGTYSVTFQDLAVDNITVEVVRTGGVPATNNDIAAALEAAINADDELRSFFIVTVATNVVTVQARANGDAFTLVTAAPAPGTLTAADTQAATPANLPMGIGVVLSGNGDKQITPPVNGVSTAFQISGITWDGDSKTDQTVIPTLGTAGEFVPSFAAGSMVPVMEKGVMYVEPEVDVAAGDPVFVRVTAAGAEVLGALRNDADGGDAVQIQAKFEWDGLAGQPTAVRLNLPGV
jgi:hypothetical protein